MGRSQTTGRFETREELEAFVREQWANSPLNIAQIARRAQISHTLAGKILDSKPTAKSADED